MGEALSLGAITVSVRPRRTGSGSDIESFCNGRERISFSAGLRKPEAIVRFLDCYGKWCLCVKQEKGRVKITGLTIGKVVDYGLKIPRIWEHVWHQQLVAP